MNVQRTDANLGHPRSHLWISDVLHTLTFRSCLGLGIPGLENRETWGTRLRSEGQFGWGTGAWTPAPAFKPIGQPRLCSLG